tara:strand:+ start:318 stop:434 length:117 start_codon:yes stop_codon:yes gene_type:complete
MLVLGAKSWFSFVASYLTDASGEDLLHLMLADWPSLSI